MIGWLIFIFAFTVVAFTLAYWSLRCELDDAREDVRILDGRCHAINELREGWITKHDALLDENYRLSQECDQYRHGWEMWQVHLKGSREYKRAKRRAEEANS